MPKGIYTRNKETTIEQTAPDLPKPEVVESPAPKVRQYDKEGIELCFNCNHRTTMHHVWKETQRIVNYRRLDNYATGQSIVTDRNPDFSVDKRPCQHACKCTEFK